MLLSVNAKKRKEDEDEELGFYFNCDMVKDIADEIKPLNTRNISNKLIADTINKKISMKSRHAFYLRYGKKLTLAEIGFISGVSGTAITGRIDRFFWAINNPVFFKK